MQQTVSIIISGKVQGVFFRQGAKEKADELAIGGYVKNLPDDTVYIMATGSDEQLKKLIEWCRRGPRRAEVTGIKVLELPLQEFKEFTIDR